MLLKISIRSRPPLNLRKRIKEKRSLRLLIIGVPVSTQLDCASKPAAA